VNEQDLSRFEAELKIALPQAYRELVLARAAELKSAGCFDDSLSAFWIDPDEVVEANKLERPQHSGTSYAFPRWWETFFLVGTNGGGAYYCLRLDNQPGLWMIGSDCGGTPRRVAPSLAAFVDRLLEEHEAEEEAATRRQAVFQEEEAEEARAAAEAGNERAQEWLNAKSPDPMFDYLDNLGRKLSPRRLRLFGIACCRRIWDTVTDADSRRAVLLAEAMVRGEAAPEEVASLRAHMNDKRQAIARGENPTRANLWCVGAAENLLQDDQDYLGKATTPAGGGDLLRVWYCVRAAVPWDSEVSQAQADLLREVVGNPFCPVHFEPGWRTPAAVALARAIESQDFDRMPELAEALAAAGCDNPRVLAHCRRKSGHVRGCWVLDALLGLNDPEPAEQEFTWDFHWQHPTIDNGDLKERLRAFGTDAAGKTDWDEKAALGFADWLESRGDRAWAGYIRVRCALDGKAPGENYPDLYEQYLETGAMRPGHARFGGFWFSGYRFTEDWWDDRSDDTEQGLPSQVDAVPPCEGSGPVAGLIQRLDALVRNTPVRGLDLDWHYAEEIAAVLDSPGARHLRRLSFANRPAEGKPGPVIVALARSPLAQTLERLDIGDGLRSDADVHALADTPFTRLRRLDLHAYIPVACSAKAVTRLMTAPWFRKLEWTDIGFSEECCETGMLQLAGMPRLHTLLLHIPPDRQVEALSRAGEFPALRRLYINSANLAGKGRQAFVQLKAPQLLELWLRNSKVNLTDVRALVASSLFGGLRALTFDGTMIDEKGLEAVAGSASGPALRILRISGGGNLTGKFRSLAESPLTRAGAFPELTTLELKYVYTARTRKDTAEFLRKLVLPRLRHLTLDWCGFDDECAEVLARNPAFATLTRLELKEAALSPKAAAKLFRSPHLQRLVELHIDPPLGEAQATFGQSIEVLLDPSLLPALAAGWLSTKGVAADIIQRLKALRPGLSIYQ
jgi:hypothetical protein